ncbi:MAG: aldehyde dehydrogenase family protein [Deltaproteobacteria bacterium]|nr:aldehyde dehydrogenase family protein [Myxococcales bacterium]MDP3218862.1 aldehyde dehydrogenase family protein [Deltaproteobacteria bacterium]
MATSTPSVSMEMSASAHSTADTPTAHLDELLTGLRAKALEFARLSVSARAALLRACLPCIRAQARPWVEAAFAAKALDPKLPQSSEEWLAGPMATMRNTRLLAENLERLATTGNPGPDDAKIRLDEHGRAVVEVFPNTLIDNLLYGGFTATVRMKAGMTPAEVRKAQGAFYKQSEPKGGVSLVLGAGNVASIPPMDALYKMFVDGNVCLVKLNPVNEYLEEFLDKAFAPLVEKGYLQFVKGGTEVGTYLVNHPEVDDVHITGSDRTHDLIVWGPAGPERERRMREDDPVLKKAITSELGCVTPVMITPGPYSDSELAFIAQNIATMMVNNASCNCNAGKMMITAKGWSGREKLLGLIKSELATQKPRKAYYPGAFERYAALAGDRPEAVKLGDAKEGELPWTLMFGLDSANRDEDLFITEPFCPILSETSLEAADAVAFLKAATAFCNDRLWGTLSAVLLIHPKTEREPGVAEALYEAVDTLRYGAVGINQWTGLVYGLVTPPWGAHPSSTLKNVQGGLGWVHNTFMLEGIEKVVLRGPLTVFPKPPWFVTSKTAHELGPRLVEMEYEPSVLKVPGIAITALRG